MGKLIRNGHFACECPNDVAPVCSKRTHCTPFSRWAQVHIRSTQGPQTPLEGDPLGGRGAALARVLALARLAIALPTLATAPADGKIGAPLAALRLDVRRGEVRRGVDVSFRHLTPPGKCCLAWPLHPSSSVVSPVLNHT
jgi:hypothetical protein